MSTPEQQAERMATMAAAIIVAIDQTGGTSDVHVMMGSLGAVIGAVAQATGRPEECLDLAMEVARRVIRGSLLGN